MSACNHSSKGELKKAPLEFENERLARECVRLHSELQQFVKRACAAIEDIAPRYYGLKFSKVYRHRIDTLEDAKQALRDEFK